MLRRPSDPILSRALRCRVSGRVSWPRRLRLKATGAWALSPIRALRVLHSSLMMRGGGGHYSFGNGGNVLNPHDAIAAQARYLAELRTRLAKYASNEDELQDVVLAGYNAGPGSVEKYGGVPPFEETQNYVKSIRELSNSKYKLTCAPEYQFKQAKLKFVNGVTPAMAGVHADGTALSLEESASAAAEASTSASASASARPSASGSAGSSGKPSVTSSGR